MSRAASAGARCSPACRCSPPARVVVWYNLAGNPIHGSRFHGGSPLVTWLTSTTVLFRYLAAAAWPAHLRSFYYIPLHGSPFDPPVALALAGLAGLAILTAWLAVRRRREAFWLVWFLIALAPMLNIVPFPTLMQDRYMYLPLVGLLAAPACAIDAALRGPRARRLAAAAAAAPGARSPRCSAHGVSRPGTTSSACGATGRSRSGYLPVDVGPLRGPTSDQHLALLDAAVRDAPGDVILRHNLGALLYERGELDRAKTELEAARDLGAGDSGVALLNLGRVYLQSGDAPRALVVLQRSVALEPFNFYGQLNLARAALALGDTDAAAAALDACDRIRPNVPQQNAPEREQLERLRRTS